MRDRILGIVGLVMLAGALVWAVIGGDAEPVGALVVIGLGSVIADAIVWRFAEPDLAVPDGVVLPSAPWGLLVGPAGSIGLAAAAVVGVPLLAVACGLVLVGSLPGLYARFPGGALPLRVTGHARRIRDFVRSHGAAGGDSVPGYLAPVGENGARLFVFAPDGSWADLMIRMDEAETITRLARVELREPTDPDAGRSLSTGRRFWDQMNKSW